MPSELKTDSLQAGQYQPEIIPIGVNCDIAHFLRKNSLRGSAYPFDWSITPLKTVIELIENGFEGFLSEDNLVYLQPVQRILFKEYETDLEITDDIITPVLCRRYNMLFPHDFSVNAKVDLVEVQKKYEKRTQRLLNILDSEKEVWFVRHETQLNAWQLAQYHSAGLTFDKDAKNLESNLTNVLRRKYPLLNFRLLELNEFKILMKAE